jgi:hypothetical protein
MHSRKPHHGVLAASAMLAASLCCPPLQAQWPEHQTPGIPRTPNGKPDLSAPVPRLANGKPDFSGLWRDDTAGGAETSKAMDRLKPQPWAATLAAKRKEDLFRDSYAIQCLPPGPIVNFGVGKVVETPNLLLMLFNATLYREVFLDGRDLPKDPNPDWMGYSAGHWEGDTLVIETAGFNDRSWLDDEGHPHTEALHVTERLRRPDFGHLELTKTMTDPGALLEPWTIPFKYVYDADRDPLEYVCNENERDRQHLIGKFSDVKGVAVDPEVLTSYAGVYELKPPERPDITIPVNIVLDNGQLMLVIDGPKQELTPLSTTQFAAVDGTSVEFFKNASGVVTHLIARTVEGDIKATRK